jgi:hypothetical protein
VKTQPPKARDKLRNVFKNLRKNCKSLKATSHSSVYSFHEYTALSKPFDPPRSSLTKSKASTIGKEKSFKKNLMLICLLFLLLLLKYYHQQTNFHSFFMQNHIILNKQWKSLLYYITSHKLSLIWDFPFLRFTKNTLENIPKRNSTFLLATLFRIIEFLLFLVEGQCATSWPQYQFSALILKYLLNIVCILSFMLKMNKSSIHCSN